MKRMMLVSGALALVAVALFAYLAMDKPQPKTPEEEWRPGKLLQAESGIVEISVTSEGKTINLVYKPEFDSYILVSEGKEYLGDNIMIERLINAVRELKREKLIDLDPTDLTIYGLKPPMIALSIKFEGIPEPVELEVGKENYTRDALFGKLKSEPTVFLIPIGMRVFFGIDMKYFRSRTLLLTTPMNVASIEFKINDPILREEMKAALLPKLVVQKQVSRRPQWVIVSPIGENAVFSKIDKFFEILRRNDSLDIVDVQSEDLKNFGLDQPRAEIILNLIPNGQQKILFGREEDERVYVMNNARNEVMLVPKYSMYNLLLFSGRKESPLTENRELLPLKVQVDYPRSGMPSMLLDLNPDGISYSVENKPDLSVRLGRVRRITKPLRGEGIAFVYHREPYPREKFGLDNPYMHVRFLEGDTIPLDIAFGDTTKIDDVVFTYVEDLRRKCIVMVPGNLRNQIPFGENEFVAPLKKREE